MKTTKNLTLVCLTLIISLIMITASAFAESPDDHDAIKGVTSGKALFDINLSKAEQVPLYLQVIGMTHKASLLSLSLPSVAPPFSSSPVKPMRKTLSRLLFTKRSLLR